MTAALEIVRQIPTRVFVLHLGDPTNNPANPDGNSRMAAVRSVEALANTAGNLSISLALEIIPNDVSTSGSLVELLEEQLEPSNAGICLDFGHAFLMGDLVDAIKTASGHLLTTHLHDNRGPRDEHLVPFEGEIDWPHALMALRKIGYDGMLLFEVGNTGAARVVLERARQARARLERLLKASG